MQALRRASFLVRLVLAWFALSLGVAVAAPLVSPVAVELICSAGGIVKVMAQGGEGGQPASHASLDCPLCATAGAPPFAAQGMAEPLPREVVVAAAMPAAPIAIALAAPPPARGPPAR